MSISDTNGVNNAQHAQRMHENRELETMRDKDHVAAGVLGNQNTVSHYDGGVRLVSTSQQTFPIGAPAAGTANTLASYDTNELSALLAGTQTEVGETQNKNAQETARANAEQVKSKREENIENLKAELSRTKNEQDDKCATAKIVLGALLIPLGLPLMLDGISDKNNINKSAGITAEKREQVLALHYGENGAAELGEFSRDYHLDTLIAQDNADTKAKYLGKLDDLKARGIIAPELYADLYTMVKNNETANIVADRILSDAAATYVDLEAAASKEKTSTATAQTANKAVENNDEFMKFLAQQAQMAEEQEEALRKVQEDLESGVSIILSGQQNSLTQVGQKTSFI